MSEKIGEKMNQLGAQLKAAESFDERARGWMLDYIEASEARATVLYLEREEARRAAEEATYRAERADRRFDEDRAKLDAERAALIDERAKLDAETEELRAEYVADREGRAEQEAYVRALGAELEATRIALDAEREELRGRRQRLEAELELARSGPARRQPWHNPEGSPADRARAQLQDALYHVQRDGEIGLARICATYAVEILYLQRDPCPMPRSLRDLEIVGRRLRDIHGQLDADTIGKMNVKELAAHLRIVQLDAAKARAELRGEDWNG